MLATQDVSQRCKELGIQALHINMQVTGSNMTKTMPNLNNQTVIGDCKCAMKIVDEESENGDVIQVDVDIHKEKRKKYNKEYYARCKENKMKRITNGEDGSYSPCAAASQPKVPSIQVKVYTAKEKQRIINEKYHAQSKEKLKIRRIAYGEGNGQSKTLVTNISAMETTQKNMNKGTTAVSVGGRRNTHNKTYHQQRNEQNRMIRLREDSSFKPPARKRVLQITPNEKTIVSTEIPFQNSLLLEITPNLLGVEGSENHNRVASLTLQAELEKLSKVKNIADKFHEAIKLKLKSDFEKEVEEMIGEMNRKYEAKCQKVEAAFQMKTNEIDIHLDKVVMNKILSEALRSKCQDLDVYGYRACKLS